MRKLYLALHKKAAWTLCAFALVAASCNNDDDPKETFVDHGAPVEAGMPVEATLSVGVDEAQSSIHTYSSSRAVESVSNLWILEYDASGKCLASQKIESYSAGKEIKVNLVAGSGVDLYAIANAGDMSFSNMSLSDLKAASWGGETASLSKLPYVGYAKVDIAYANFSSRDLKLQKIGSEVKISYVVDSKSPYNVTSFQLCNVPKKFYLIPGAAIAAGDVENKEVITEELGQVYTYIIPENMQGVDSSITNAKDKKTDKPATYVEIKGSYEDPSVAMAYDSSYKMYLGENNTNDFNVCRNKVYSFIGNLRLEDADDNRVDVDESAAPYRQPESNCYMLMPNAQHALAIPVSRVNAFWKSIDSRYELNDGENDSRIQKWVVKVIWQDGEGEIIKFEKADGAMADEYFVVAPAGSGKEGNVIVGIYDATKGDDIDVASANPLWSWHIWVTPYQPGDKGWVPMPAYVGGNLIDASDNWTKRAAYSVPGGKIYQQNGCQQTSTTLATVDCAMMDRNLGATSSDKSQYEKTIGFYYQWGRKDPFMATPPAGAGESWVPASIDFSTKEAQEVSFTALNPTKFISVMGDWAAAKNDKFWNSDPSYGIAKSIYDPCPVGWMIPKHDVFTVLTVGSYNMSGTYKPYVSRSKALSGTTAADLANAFDAGYLFWPDDMQAWFPASGRINAGAGKMFEYKDTGRWWTLTVSGVSGAAYRMSRYDASEDEENMYNWRLCVNEGNGSNGTRATGQTVRCVMEK